MLDKEPVRVIFLIKRENIWKWQKYYIHLFNILLIIKRMYIIIYLQNKQENVFQKNAS